MFDYLCIRFVPPLITYRLSTPELIRLIANAFGKPPRLYPVPEKVLKICGSILRKEDMIERIIGTLAVDGILPNWSPRISVEHGLKETVDRYCRIKG